MSPRARFTGGGPRDGDDVDLPNLPDTYEVTSAGTVWVYRRQDGGGGGTATYRLDTSRPG